MPDVALKRSDSYMIRIIDNVSEINASNKELDSRFSDIKTKKMTSFLNPDREGVIRVQDRLKGCDYLLALEIIQKNFGKSAHIANLGAYKDASLWYLSELGFQHLYGIDLNRDILNMPFSWRIKYMYGDMLDTHFPSNMFDAVLSISAIEHGDGVNYFKSFLKEAKRLLKNNGILFITTDYNETRIDTGKHTAFKKRWHIFNAKEINEIINYAQKIGFELYDKNSKLPKQKGAPIHSSAINKDYAFLQITLRLKKVMKIRVIKEVNIVCASLGLKDGISEYSYALAQRFDEVGVRVNLFKHLEAIKNKYPTILQFESGMKEARLPNDKNVIIELHTFPNMQNKIQTIMSIFTIKSPVWRHPLHSVKNFLSMNERQSKLSDKHPLLVFNNELVEGMFKRYTIMPHIKYPYIRFKKKIKKGLCIGTFGFATRAKNVDKICNLAKRLGIKAVIVLGVSNVSGEVEEEGLAEIRRLRNKYGSNKIKIINSFNREKALSELSVCTHILFAQENTFTSSGAMRFPMQLNVPIVSIDNYQARETQLHRVKSFDDITIKYLKNTTEPTRLDDGFYYLMKYLESR